MTSEVGFRGVQNDPRGRFSRSQMNMENYCDFEIENGVLTKYWGYDENVTIPEGVTSLGENILGM